MMHNLRLMHLRQHVLDTPLQLTKLIRSPKAEHQRLCPSSDKSIEPGSTALGRAGTQALLACHHVVWGAIVAFDKGLHLSLSLGYVVIDVQRRVHTAGERLRILSHL